MWSTAIWMLFASTSLMFSETSILPDQDSGRISIQVKLSPEQFRNSNVFPLCFVSYRLVNPTFPSTPIEESEKPQGGNLNIVKDIKGPSYINFSSFLLIKNCGQYLVEPGDDVVIHSEGSNLYFSGYGHEKYQLKYKLDSLHDVLEKLFKGNEKATESTKDYYEYVNCLNKEFDLSIKLINNYRGLISDFSLETFKANEIKSLIKRFYRKFYSLRDYLYVNKEPIDKLSQIYDTSFAPAVNRWLQYSKKRALLQLDVRSIGIDRLFNFDTSRILSQNEKNLLLLKDALKVYKGVERESFLLNTLSDQIINQKSGFTPEVEKLLEDYYKEPGYPECKKWMKEREISIREYHMNDSAPEFFLVDNRTKPFGKKDLQGKYSVLCFIKNNKIAEGIKQLQEEFKNNKEIMFVFIPAENMNNQKMIHDYAVVNFPTVWIMHPDGHIMNSAKPKIDYLRDGRKALTDFLYKHFSYRKDGPYVFHEGPKTISFAINHGKLIKIDNPRQLTVQTDLQKTYTVMLKKSLQTEPDVFIRPEKLLVLSDIEGNFDSYRKLLQANKVIDENYNWIFGNGHLVINGDMVDRGEQVTECLWLTYSLEEKAKTAGGYVHFILGNHEIMNMKGDHRYVEKKYKGNSKLMGKTLTELCDENSELGRWLRTKNIMEKVGDLLFVHGGISLPVLRMNIGMKEMNKLARPYYGAKQIDSSNTNLLTLYETRRIGPGGSYPSPFWFRGYWGELENLVEMPTVEQIDSTLQKFDVKHIFTGHTLKGIMVRYDGKAFNTDTFHEGGRGEAILVDGQKFYKANAEGKKVLLFIDDKKKITTSTTTTNAKTE